jgi:ribosome-associated protein
VLPTKLEIKLESGIYFEIPLREFEFTFARSSGPGGQNVNKVNSKAVMRWNVSATTSIPHPVRARFLTTFASRLTSAGELVISSDRFRDQGKNVDDCLKKVYDMIYEVGTPPKVRRKTKPSRGSKIRREKSKSAHSEKKQGRGKVRF